MKDYIIEVLILIMPFVFCIISAFYSYDQRERYKGSGKEIEIMEWHKWIHKWAALASLILIIAILIIIFKP